MKLFFFLTHAQIFEKFLKTTFFVPWYNWSCRKEYTYKLLFLFHGTSIMYQGTTVHVPRNISTNQVYSELPRQLSPSVLGQVLPFYIFSTLWHLKTFQNS